MIPNDVDPLYPKRGWVWRQLALPWRGVEPGICPTMSDEPGLTPEQKKQLIQAQEATGHM